MARPWVKRLTRWTVRGGLLLGVLVFGYLIYVGIEQATARGRLHALQAELDRTDPGWRYFDLHRLRNGRLPDDSRNPARQGLAAHAATVGVNGMDGWNRRIMDRHNGNYTWLPETELNRLPVAVELADARCTRDTNLGPIDLLHRARHLPGPGGIPREVGDDPFGLLLPDVQQMRECAALLQLDAVVSAADGDPDRAAESAVACLAVGRGMGEPTTLIEMLVRVAICQVGMGNTERTLALCEPSDKALAELQAAFLAEAEVNRLKPALRGERAGLDHFMTRVADGNVPLATVAGLMGAAPGVGEQALVWMYKVQYLTADHVFMLELFNKWIAATDAPPHTRPNFEKDIPPKGIRHLLSRGLMPAVEKCMHADTRCVASMRCAGAAVACERFRQARGRWPESLAELGPLLPTVPIDPYDGKPIRYVRVPGGAVVYSIGYDRQDDGGNIGWRIETGYDYGFRLWDADRRAAEPEPEPDGEP